MPESVDAARLETASMAGGEDKTHLSELRVGALDMMLIGVPHLRLPNSELSAGEHAVVELALMGLSNKEISARRGVSARTVANQLRVAYSKLGVSSRFELAAALGRAQDPRDRA